MERRTFIKLSAAVAGSLFLGVGCTTPAVPPALFPKPKFGELAPEAFIDASGKIQVNPDVIMRHSVCMGCYSSCGIRARVDKKTGKLERVAGNPYNPKNAQPILPYETSLVDAYKTFGLGEQGHKHRATICARGNAAFEQIYDPRRILSPLKRVAGRGEGKWKPITWEQLVQETVEGGQIFKDAGDATNIEGFRKVYDVEKPLNPAAPELGPKSNGLLWLTGGSYGRVEFIQRFVNQSYGSANFYGHTGS